MLKINTKDLLATTKLAAKLKAGGTLAFCKQFRLRPVADGQITVEATNCEVFFIRNAYGEGQLTRPCLVDKKAFQKALTAAAKRGDEVELRLDIPDDQASVGLARLEITAGSMKVRIEARDADDMPEPPTIKDDAQSFVVDNGKKYFGALAKYLSKDDNRPNLECLCLATNGQAVAVDGHRLLAVSCLDEKPEDDILVNGTAIRLALAALPGDDYAINVDDKAIEITAFNGTRIVCRRKEGQFPDFAAALPKPGAATFVEIDAKALKGLAVDIAPWTGKTKRARIEMHDGEPAKVYASDVELGEMLLTADGTECTTSMVVDRNTHAKHKFGLNVAYLKDAAEIATIFGDTIRIECDDPYGPVQLLSVEGSEVEFSHVVMPMRA